MKLLSNAEKEMLKQFYPEGCRVKLEYMREEPYGCLAPGDMGTVQFIDDAGQIHVSWDRGGSLAIVYKVDKCQCVMTKEQMESLLQQLSQMPFESIRKMCDWIEEKFLPVFPKLSYGKISNNEIVVELWCPVFTVKEPSLSIRFNLDAAGHVFVEKYELRGKETPKKAVSERETNTSR